LFRKLVQITPQLSGAGHDEFIASINGGREFEALGPFPPVPVYLLRKSQWDPSDSPQFRARVLQMQQAMVALSPCGVDQEVSGAGHYVHRDRPDVVIATIRTAVESDGCR
jgi:pimeloyl-ACP methyl ester carboxylesterase